MKTVLVFLITAVSLSSSYPGLLKIPKVYNALITSDQNLTPSRAFPVLQPVIHRTAFGYVPPFYYPQFAPQFVPEVIDLTQLVDQEKENKKDQSDSKKPSDKTEKEEEKKEEKKPEEPLKFYPNYQTVLYDPYFYTYSGLGPQVEQVPYQDYYTHQMLDPLPPETNDKYAERLLPHLHEEAEKKVPEKEKIPDVPPPPLPSGTPKNKSTS